jgi:alpha-glucosidase (family GH31 glycosyl hydrolase)
MKKKFKLLGRSVIYPDFTMEKTREWWKDALQRFVNTDQVIKFDGLFLVNSCTKIS